MHLSPATQRFAFLQQYPSVVHMDVHLLQVLSRQSTANLPCNAGSASFRPHVVLSDFEQRLCGGALNNSYVPAGVVPPEVVALNGIAVVRVMRGLVPASRT